MTKQEFYAQLDEILENEPGTIKGNEQLADIEKWDSMAAVLFIAMMDREISVTAEPSRVAAAKTVQDLVAIGGDKIS